MRQNSDAALVEELRLNPLPYFRHVAKALTQLVEQLRPELGGALYDGKIGFSFFKKINFKTF